jgi:hypothetical protein
VALTILLFWWLKERLIKQLAKPRRAPTQRPTGSDPNATSSPADNQYSESNDPVEHAQRASEGLARRAKHIFDYSCFRDDIGRDSSSLIWAMRNTLLDIEELAKHVPCVSASTFSEVPSSGMERIKYSFESGPSQSGLTYLLHVEVDRRLRGAPDQLSDVRLVVSVPTDFSSDIFPNARHLIGECVRQLALSNKAPEDVKRFFEDRLGWEWPVPNVVYRRAD